jgi:hypothetical protein
MGALVVNLGLVIFQLAADISAEYWLYKAANIPI